MTNEAFARLRREWSANHLNSSAVEYAESAGISDYNAHYIDTDRMNEVRKLCKKNSVWLKDSDELSLYIEYMPFGGYKEYSDIKHIIKEFHAYEKEHGNRAALKRFL